MKSKELIRRLQEADPEGEMEVCVGNVDIYFVEKKAAYWDGNLQVLQHDEAKRGKQWSIIGLKIFEKGSKLDLNCVDAESLIYDKPDIDVDLSDLSEDPRQRWQERIANWRKEGLDMNEGVEEWAKGNQEDRLRNELRRNDQ